VLKNRDGTGQSRKKMMDSFSSPKSGASITNSMKKQAPDQMNKSFQSQAETRVSTAFSQQQSSLLSESKHRSLGMETFYKSNNLFKVQFSHDVETDEIFKANPELKEFQKKVKN
jgi:hypothetical protein